MLLSPRVSKQSVNSMSKTDSRDNEVNRVEEGEGWRDWASKNLEEVVVKEWCRGWRG